MMVKSNYSGLTYYINRTSHQVYFAWSLQKEYWMGYGWLPLPPVGGDRGDLDGGDIFWAEFVGVEVYWGLPLVAVGMAKVDGDWLLQLVLRAPLLWEVLSVPLLNSDSIGGVGCWLGVGCKVLMGVEVWCLEIIWRACITTGGRGEG